jgi:predicted transposase/invertase (TIGR01784 family)
MLKERLLTYSEEAELRGRDEGRKEGRNEGIKEGRNEGIKEGIEKVAKGLLAEGVSPDIIARGSGLPLDTVKALMN